MEGGSKNKKAKVMPKKAVVSESSESSNSDELENKDVTSESENEEEQV
jgi:hypothetical protein